MRVFVTGSEGFVGTNLCAALEDAGHEVARNDPRRQKSDYIQGSDAVIHLAANADVRDGWSDELRDFYHTQNTLYLLREMRRNGIRRLLFASSSAVYGNAPTPTPETYAGQQTSLYGASKLACEGLIGAYAAAGHISATVLRLTSMLGPHYRHGLVADFVKQLQDDPTKLRVLGGGSVQRTRMDVSDGVAAFMRRLKADPGYEVFNVGTSYAVTSLAVAEEVAFWMDCKPYFDVVEESWVGDHDILLDCTKLRATGWRPQYKISQGIKRTVDWLLR